MLHLYPHFLLHVVRMTTYSCCMNSNVHVWILVCLYFDCRPSREFFTHVQTSLLSVKGCKTFPFFLGGGGGGEGPMSCEGSLACYTRSNTRHPLIYTFLTVELSLPVLTVCRGRDSNTRPSVCEANESSNQLRHHRGYKCT